MWKEFKRQVGGLGREAARQLTAKTADGKKKVTSRNYDVDRDEDYQAMDETLLAYGDFLKSAEED